MQKQSKQTKLSPFFIVLFTILLISCSDKLNNSTTFITKEFIKSHKGLPKKELNTKLDSILKNNKHLTLENQAFIFFEKGKNQKIQIFVRHRT